MYLYRKWVMQKIPTRGRHIGACLDLGFLVSKLMRDDYFWETCWSKLAEIICPEVCTKDSKWFTRKNAVQKNGGPPFVVRGLNLQLSPICRLSQSRDWIPGLNPGMHAGSRLAFPNLEILGLKNGPGIAIPMYNCLDLRCIDCHSDYNMQWHCCARRKAWPF